MLIAGFYERIEGVGHFDYVGYRVLMVDEAEVRLARTQTSSVQGHLLVLEYLAIFCQHVSGQCLQHELHAAVVPLRVESPKSSAVVKCMRVGIDVKFAQ